MVEELNELRTLAEGFIKFSIKAADTEENKKVHDAFKEFCKIECDNNYTQGIRKLLEFYEADYKYESLHASIMMLQESVLEIKDKIENKKEENKGAF